MIRLFGVEVRRDLARRLTRLLILAFLLGTALGLAIAWVNIDTYSDEDLALREEQAIQQCVINVTTFGVPTGPPATFVVEGGPAVELPTGSETETLEPDEAERVCREQLEAQRSGEYEGIVLIYYDDPRPTAIDFWDPEQNENSFFGGIQTLIMLVALGAAASMIGAEWKAGTVTTQLTWFPKRIPLFFVKVVAAVGLAVVIAFALQLLFSLLVLGLISAKGGVMDDMDSAWWGNLFAGMGRGCFLVGIAAALGASLAMIFRNTAGAVIVVFAYVAVAESLLRLWQPDWEPWFIGQNIAIIIGGHALEGVEWHKEPLAAAFTLVGYALIAVAAAAASFRTRDIAGAS